MGQILAGRLHGLVTQRGLKSRESDESQANGATVRTFDGFQKKYIKFVRYVLYLPMILKQHVQRKMMGSGLISCHSLNHLGRSLSPRFHVWLQRYSARSKHILSLLKISRLAKGILPNLLMPTAMGTETAVSTVYGL